MPWRLTVLCIIFISVPIGNIEVDKILPVGVLKMTEELLKLSGANHTLLSGIFKKKLSLTKSSKIRLDYARS